MMFMQGDTEIDYVPLHVRFFFFRGETFPEHIGRREAELI
jgi:hypothetical protein